MCVGLGVKGDVHEIEQFYSEVSGVNLEMSGFIDLSALALVAGYQMNVKGMTPMGVQVLGAILIKCVSTAENLCDMSLDEILSDVEWEPTVVEILTPAVSIVVGDPVEDQE